MRKLLAVLTGVFVAGGSWAQTANQPLSVTNPKKAIVVPADQNQFQLVLAANPTTGYRWFLVTIDHHLLQPVSTKYLPANPKMMGSGGMAVWTFQLKRSHLVVPQLTKLELRYARTWQMDDSKDTTYSVVLLPASSG